VTQIKKADKERLARLFLAHLIVYRATRFYVTVPLLLLTRPLTPHIKVTESRGRGGGPNPCERVYV